MILIAAITLMKYLDFICQQPRWGFRLRKWPISTWIRFSESEQCTTSIVSYGLEDERITVVQTRLAACFQGSDKVSAATANASDPFLLPTMISHECFMQSDRGVFELGNRLYSALDAVDKVSEEKYNRDDLASITSKLHQVSQDAESLIQSTDIAISILDGMVDAQESLARSSCVRSKHQVQLSINASGYLKRAVEARKRWLEGAKSRKETTMNLVYNLVNQKEAETSIAIARDTKDDSSSMKAIAALTMVFLPATAVTSFFGMGFFDGGGGNFTVAPEWWIFLAVTVPLTIGLVVIWWMWDTLRVQAAGCEAFMNSAPRLRRACWSLLSSRRRRPEEAQSSAKYVV